METMATKRCTRCKQEKPVTEFNKDQSRKGGLDNRCRECDRARRREYQKRNASRNPDEITVPPEKRCPKCGITRPSSEWHRDSTRSGGLANYCKPCVRAKSAKYRAENGEKLREKSRERMRRWREANPDKARESMRRWAKANPDKVRENYRRWAKANPDKRRALEHRRRAREAGAFTVPHTEEDLLDFWRFIGIDPSKCWYCALDGRDAPKEHTDHLIPLSRGGSETVWNKRPACSACNTSKGARVFPAGTGDEEARRIAQEQANLTRLWMAAHNLID